MNVTFVTGNQNKANYLAKLLGMPILHRKIDVDEIQSMDLHEVATHKAQQAYEVLKSPVLVEDQGLYFNALGGFPGPFIKFLVESTGDINVMCKVLHGFEDRSAVARTVFAYYDGSEMRLFEGELAGEIAEQPKGENGWGWDPVFCPEGFGGRTRAEFNPEEDDVSYMKIKPIQQVRDFLESKNE